MTTPRHDVLGANIWHCDWAAARQQILLENDILILSSNKLVVKYDHTYLCHKVVIKYTYLCRDQDDPAIAKLLVIGTRQAAATPR